MAYVYLLECSDGSFYVGSTTDLELRLEEHAAGVVDAYTSSHAPVSIVWYEEFERIDEAFAMERRIKGWRREKKRALIEGRYRDLPELSRTAASKYSRRS